jgi:hypothetical protein
MTIKEHLEEALDQVSKALIGALQDKDEDQVVKLFELYNQVKGALPKDTSGFMIDFSDYNVAAGPVDVPYGGLGQDVISFGGDTTISSDTISLG